MPNESHTDPETLERGRYRVLGTPDGGLVILRSTALCDRCHACTCGDKQEPIGPIPGALVAMMRQVGAGNGGKLPGPGELIKMMSAVRNGRRG